MQRGLRNLRVMRPFFSRRNLQIAVAIAGLVPLGAGLAGILAGPGFVGQTAPVINLTSHFAYLSGLLLGIGLLFYGMIPRIERQGPRFRLLTLIVAIGGLARLFSLLTVGVPGFSMLFGLTMELVVTPLLCLWQWRVERRGAALV